MNGPGAKTYALTALALSAFAANSLLCRAALAAGRADALTFTSLRLISGAVVLATIARATRRPRAEGRANRAALALLAYALLFSLAYTRIPAAVGALALFGAVQVTMVTASVLRGERPSRGETAGLLLALLG